MSNSEDRYPIDVILKMRETALNQEIRDTIYEIQCTDRVLKWKVHRLDFEKWKAKLIEKDVKFKVVDITTGELVFENGQSD
jgi:hypothetical protein